jgi:hypothetical protein
MLMPSLYMLKMDNVSLKSPSPFRFHLIIASMFGQEKGPSQGGINGSRGKGVLSKSHIVKPAHQLSEEKQRGNEREL